MALYLAIALPAFAGTSGTSKNDWGRLSKLAETDTVKVHLRDGRALTGSILEFQSDGLTFLDERKVTKIRQSRITAAAVTELDQVFRIEGAPHLQTGQTVELKLRDGRILSGRVREAEANGDSLTLVEPGAAERIAREAVVRVIRSRRAKSAKIGAIAGAASLTGLMMAVPKDSLGPGESKAQLMAAWGVGGAIVGGAVGAGIGAAIGYPETLYEAPAR